jgi:HSP20 family protein
VAGDEYAGAKEAIWLWSVIRVRLILRIGNVVHNGKEAQMVLVRREAQGPMDLFDRFFDLWPEQWHRPVMMWQAGAGDLLRVDEYMEDGTLVIRAELAGVDPGRDVDVTVEHGILRIAAERRDEKTVDEKAYRRRELRYGALKREFVLPEGVTADEIKAAYKDGVLEIRVAVPVAGEPEVPPVTKIPVTAA